MRKGSLAFLFFALFIVVNAQNGDQNDRLMGIRGTITDMRHVQDDISFYTWSLYLTVDLGTSWFVYQDSLDIKIDTAEIHKGCDDVSLQKLKFNKCCFYSEKDIKQFPGVVHKGSRVKVYARKSSMEKFFRGESCQVKMEAIRRIRQ